MKSPILWLTLVLAQRLSAGHSPSPGASHAELPLIFMDLDDHPSDHYWHNSHYPSRTYRFSFPH